MSGKSKLHTIYERFPVSIQNIMISAYGYKLYRARYGYIYHDYLNELRSKDYSNFEKEKEYQNQEFLKLLKYAVNKSSFYKEFYKEIDISKIRGVEDINMLPILEKEMVRNNINNIYTISFKKGIKSFTSGTTGKSMMFLYRTEDIQKRLAYLDFFKEKHGFINGGKSRNARFNAKTIIPEEKNSKVFWRDNYILKQRIYSGFHTTEANLQYYVDNINKFKPLEIDGYPSCIYELAKYIIKKNIKLEFKPIAIFPTAETLLPHYKSTIEKAFNCPVRNQYASSEGSPFITECKYGKLHYNMDTGIIETNPDGEMIVTGFHTYGTPLIRYKIGDRIIFEDKSEKCECGSCHPIVRSIEGRGVDYLISKSKGRISEIHLSLGSTQLLNYVKQMQYVQNSIDQIDVYLSVSNDYKEQLNKIIIDELQYVFGKDMRFDIHIVDEISRESSGKYRLIKNNLVMNN